MAKKWLQSADVEVSAAGAVSVATAPAGSFAGGVKTVANAANAAQLVAVATPCRSVWIGPRLDASGNALNTKPVFIGESAAKASAVEGGIPIKPDLDMGVTIRIDDASKLWIKVGANNEGVAYRIFV